MTKTLDIDEEVIKIHRQLLEFTVNREALFTSSSFQTHSLPLLHILASSGYSIPVIFLDTGYHFPETYHFVDNVEKLLKIDVVRVRSVVSKLHQIDKSNGQLLFASDPDECCYLNKVQPLEPYMNNYDVWINGVRANQSKNRSSFNEIEQTKFRAKRYHPILNWSNKMIFDYIKRYNLPKHPLEEKGFLSIGCAPCTQPYLSTSNDDRAGRWAGSNKVECGLHIELK